MHMIRHRNLGDTENVSGLSVAEAVALHQQHTRPLHGRQTPHRMEQIDDRRVVTHCSGVGHWELGAASAPTHMPTSSRLTDAEQESAGILHRFDLVPALPCDGHRLRSSLHADLDTVERHEGSTHLLTSRRNEQVEPVTQCPLPVEHPHTVTNPPPADSFHPRSLHPTVGGRAMGCARRPVGESISCAIVGTPADPGVALGPGDWWHSASDFQRETVGRRSGRRIRVALLPLSGYPDGVSVLVAAKNLPTDPLSALRMLTESEHELERIRREQVLAARAAGASWQQIGDALGVSRQSAWEAFTAATRVALTANVDANTGLIEDDALALAVQEVKAVRRRGATS